VKFWEGKWLRISGCNTKWSTSNNTDATNGDTYFYHWGIYACELQGNWRRLPTKNEWEKLISEWHITDTKWGKLPQEAPLNMLLWWSYADLASVIKTAWTDWLYRTSTKNGSNDANVYFLWIINDNWYYILSTQSSQQTYSGRPYAQRTASVRCVRWDTWVDILPIEWVCWYANGEFYEITPPLNRLCMNGASATVTSSWW
jgi:hypothetical protein